MLPFGKVFYPLKERSNPRKRYRAIFISDLHLGYELNKADRLVKFLANHDCDMLYLVGDIIDFMVLGVRGFEWRPTDTQVIDELFAMRRRGAKVYYLIGNHDEPIRQHIPFIRGVQFRDYMVHTTFDQKRYLVCHGHRFDQIRPIWGLLNKIVVRLYGYFENLSRALHLLAPFQRFAWWVMQTITVNKHYLAKFDRNAIEAIKGYDGVICGHIHKPYIKEVERQKFINCGDWVEHCSAIVEHIDGKLELITMK